MGCSADFDERWRVAVDLGPVAETEVALARAVIVDAAADVGVRQFRPTALKWR